MKICLCLIQKWNGIFTRALGVIFLVFFIGCERECIQGQIRDCTCPSRAISQQMCSESGGEWEECDCACDPDETLTRSCVCPLNTAITSKQTCKATAQSNNYFEWHPCECAAPKETSLGKDHSDKSDIGSDEHDTDEAIDAGLEDAGGQEQ